MKKQFRPDWYILYISVVTDRDKELEAEVIAKLKEKEEFTFVDSYVDMTGNTSYQVAVDTSVYKSLLNSVSARIEDFEKFI